MYQVQAFNRKTQELLMESDTFKTLEDAKEFQQSVGTGEGFFSTIFRLEAVWTDGEVS